MHRFTWTAVVCTAWLAALANGGQAQPPKPMNPDTAALVHGNSAFACDLYQQLGKENGNLFFSPYSISSALAMTYAGAQGKTAADMARTLELPFEGQRVATAFGGLMQDLNKPGQPRKYKLSIANRLWGQKGYVFSPEFLKLTREAYGAGLEELDFTKAPDASRQAINAWVEKATQDRIKDLLPPGSVANDTRLVLTNAIYFKASWQDGFSPSVTKSEDFKAAAGKTVKVDMMHHQEVLKALDDDTFQMVQLPYEDRELSMVVLLPRKADGLAALEKQLTAQNLQKWSGQTKAYNVALALPKFRFTSEFSLKKVLSDMGMASAFSNDADFSGMATAEKLHIDAVIHKAFVAVDEKGTEAAAATAVLMRPTSAQVAPPLAFRADHPFVFLIRDNATGSILFMGRVAQP